MNPLTQQNRLSTWLNPKQNPSRIWVHFPFPIFFQKLPLFMEEMLNVFFLFIVFSLPLIFTLVAASINSHRRYKMFIFSFQRNMCPLFLFLFFFLFLALALSLLSESMWTLKVSRKKELASLLLFFISRSPAIYLRNGRVLEMQNFTPAYMKGYTYILTRTDDFLRTKLYWIHR